MTLVLDKLVKRFGSGPSAVTALDELSFTVQPGEVFGFLGANGAGKTTTMRIVLDIHPGRFRDRDLGRRQDGGRLVPDMGLPPRGARPLPPDGDPRAADVLRRPLPRRPGRGPPARARMARPVPGPGVRPPPGGGAVEGQPAEDPVHRRGPPRAAGPAHGRAVLGPRSGERRDPEGGLPRDEAPGRDDRLLDPPDGPGRGAVRVGRAHRPRPEGPRRPDPRREALDRPAGRPDRGRRRWLDALAGRAARRPRRPAGPRLHGARRRPRHRPRDRAPGRARPCRRPGHPVRDRRSVARGDLHREGRPSADGGAAPRVRRGGHDGGGGGGERSLTVGARAMKLEVSNVIAIARREYVTRGRTRAFRLVTVLLVIAAFATAIAPVLLEWFERGSAATQIEVEVGDTKPAIDPVATIQAILNADAQAGSTTTGASTPSSPAYSVTAVSDDAAARARVDSGQTAGLLILGRDPATHELTFIFVTKAKAIDRISQFMAGAAASYAHLELLIQSGVPGPTLALLQAAPTYASQLPDGSPLDNSPSNFVNQFLAGFVLSIVLFIAIIVYGQWIALSVAEEKSSRVMEVILGAASPFELLAGKVIGVGGLALTQYAIIFVPALVGILLQGQIAALILGGAPGSIALPPVMSIGLLLVFGLVFALGFAFYAVLYAGAASLISRTEDIQQIVAPMSLVASAGYLVAVYSTTGLISSSSRLVSIMTYIPFFSPVMVLTRIGAGTIDPLEVVISIAILAVSVPVALWAAARLYSAGVLMYGQRPSIRLLARVLRGA